MVLSAYKYKYHYGALLVNFENNAVSGYTVNINGVKVNYPPTPGGFDAAHAFYYDNSAKDKENDIFIDTE